MNRHMKLAVSGEHKLILLPTIDPRWHSSEVTNIEFYNSNSSCCCIVPSLLFVLCITLSTTSYHFTISSGVSLFLYICDHCDVSSLLGMNRQRGRPGSPSCMRCFTVSPAFNRYIQHFNMIKK